jgi:hypothetical protein
MLVRRSIYISFFSTNSTAITPIVSDVFNGVEELCMDLNNFFLILFSYLKYLFAFILILIGLLTLFKYRGIYLKQKIHSNSSLSNHEPLKEKLKKTHVFLGMVYIFMGVGILFNYLTYILMWTLEPLPDGFLFEFLGIGNVIDPASIERISNYNLAVSPHERTIYLCFALVSFMALLEIFLSIWFLAHQGTIIHNHTKTFGILIFGIIQGMLFGFTKSLIFFI